MLPKEKRLRDTKDFIRVYNKGSFFSARLVNINYLRNKAQITRVGVVVGKKVSKRAIDRNAVKRKAREAVHSLYEKSPRGYDIIIGVKKGAKGASVADFQKELAGLFGRLEKK